MKTWPGLPALACHCFSLRHHTREYTVRVGPCRHGSHQTLQGREPPRQGQDSAHRQGCPWGVLSHLPAWLPFLLNESWLKLPTSSKVSACLPYLWPAQSLLFTGSWFLFVSLTSSPPSDPPRAPLHDSCSSLHFPVASRGRLLKDCRTKGADPLPWIQALCKAQAHGSVCVN